jgi:hypothetical protein
VPVEEHARLVALENSRRGVSADMASVVIPLFYSKSIVKQKHSVGLVKPSPANNQTLREASPESEAGFDTLHHTDRESPRR